MKGSATEEFHFCQGVPPATFAENLQNTNRLNDQQFSQLLEMVFGFLKNAEGTVEFERKVEDYSSRNSLKIKPVQDMITSILIIAKESSSKKLTAGQLFGDLQKLKMNRERSSQFCQAWRKSEEWKKSEDFDVDQLKRLVNMEWKFAVTAANSEMNKVGNCFIQLKMILSRGLTTETLSFEMSLHRFYDFMHQLEKAKLELDTV